MDTDSVTNTDNQIQAGTLNITATAASVDKTKDTFTISGVNGGRAFGFGEPQDVENGTPIITQSNWEPGQSNAKLLTVTNNGSLAAKVTLEFDIHDDGLMDALWFDFVRVGTDGSIAGTFTRRPMSQLQTISQGLDVSVPADGGSVQFILLYGMNEEAGNTYQGLQFQADVTILATQDTVETDGFGNTDYDEGAAYLTDVSSESEFLAAAQTGKNIRLTSSITLAQTVTFDKPAVLDMNGHDITVGNSTGSIRTTDKLTIKGNGTLNGAVVADTGATLVIDAGDDFTVNSRFVTGAAISAGLNTTVDINGGIYNGYEKGAGVINSSGSYVTVRNATVNVKVASMSQAAGIVAANAKETLLENVTVNGNYSIALKLNTSMSGNATIIGGTFTTNQVAEGWKPNDTIRYGGTLTISNATINRVGNGILYYKTYPLPTEVVGLTQSNVTFNQVGETAGQYSDIAYYHY